MAEMTLFLVQKKHRGRFFHQQLNNKNPPHLSALRAPIGLEHSNGFESGWLQRLLHRPSPPTTPYVTVTPPKINMVWKMIFLFQGYILRSQPLIFQGVKSWNPSKTS